MEQQKQYLIVNENGDEIFSINWFNSQKKEEIYPKIEKYIYNKIIYLLILIKEVSNENLDISLQIDKKDFIEENICLFHPAVLDKIGQRFKLKNSILIKIFEQFKHFRNWKMIAKLAKDALLELGLTNVSSENFENELQDNFLF